MSSSDSSPTTYLQRWIDVLWATLKVVLVLLLSIWIFSNRDFVETWLLSVSGGELLGFKFERTAIDDASAQLDSYVRKLSQGPDRGVSVNSQFAEAAIYRAARNAPAIVNSYILWVDNDPDSNSEIVDILSNLRIHVTRVTTTDEAFGVLRIRPVDMIITNVWRPKDPETGKRILTVCRVHYFDFPGGNDKLVSSFYSNTEKADLGEVKSHELALERFNLYENMHAPAGFGMADSILTDSKSDTSNPPIIFFSSQNAEVARPLCGYTITNRADVLLNTIVTLLEIRHYETLRTKSWSEKR